MYVFKKKMKFLNHLLKPISHNDYLSYFKLCCFDRVTPIHVQNSFTTSSNGLKIEIYESLPKCDNRLSSSGILPDM